MRNREQRLILLASERPISVVASHESKALGVLREFE